MKAKQICSVILALLLALSALTIAPAAAEGWDGETATAPAGSGTQDDPYLVSSAANLLWMSQNIKKGDLVTDTTAGDGYGPSFAGVWFEQTCDIDLNGKSLRSIGYYYANDKRMAAFGGTYDGNGYSIFNGSIVSYNTGHQLNVNWGHGLFGTIYGATIQNVVLEGLAISGHGVTGGIVGRAVASAADEDFNVIENCVVADTCAIAVYFPNNTPVTSDAFNQASRVGGIVGMAWGTTVRNCVNGADMSLPGNFTYGGGIAGTAGYGTVIDFCANTGDITLTIGSNSNAAESAYGGIVGFITPYEKQAQRGSVLISNCYNTGTFAFVGDTSSAALNRGGILGAANMLHADQTYRITNCYNLSDKNTFGDPDYTNYRVGGLVGVYWISANANASPLYIDNSYSVEITEGKNTAGIYHGTNEYRCYIDRKTTDGLVCVQIGVADGKYADAQNGSYPEGATVGTKTADEILALTAGIDEAIDSALESAIEIKAYQASKTSEDGRMSFRFLYAVESLDWSKIGIEVSMNGATLTEEGTTVYTSVLGYNPETGEDETYTAESLGASYLAALTLNNIPTTGTYTFEVKAYAVESFGETEIKNYGTVCTVTVTDGQLTIQ